MLTRLVHRDLVDEVLADTGRTERRRRLLPARVVVYFVLAMTLFFDDAYEEVMRKLVDGLRFLRSWDEDWRVPSASALCQGHCHVNAMSQRHKQFGREKDRTWWRGSRLRPRPQAVRSR